MIWFTGDTHFGHRAIIDFCNRPFSSTDEMDEALIANWNACVGATDEVWHLGDFAFRGGAGRAGVIFDRLKGRKHLIVGNHDDAATIRLPWASTQLMAEITIEKTRIVMFHYGLRVWPGMRRGAIHLYGHSHGRLPGTSNSLDAGVDAGWHFCPTGIEAIRHRLSTLPEVDPETG